ncbi:hypothetical protein C809_00936 [Lachnospiraceae bacterium MD335]|nr:hypothetical protein C809_00936 [Lachnospiraceae bacterium MD335]
MKIISVNKYEKENLEIQVNANRTCMLEVVSKEQAEKEKRDIYINDRWHYVVGHDEIHFVFLDLISYPLYGINEHIADILYELDILIDRDVYKIQLSRDEINNEKWLKDIVMQELLVVSRSKYQKLLKEIQPRKGEKMCFESIGVHKIDNQYFYVTSNCAITSKGINREIRALKEGFDLEFDETVKEEMYAEKFIQYNMMNMRVFYPVHYMQINAVLKYFLKAYGMAAGAVLWIDGVVASGKTELAYTVGDMFNRCGDNISMKKNLYSTKIKIKELEKKLTDYQNAVLILDDVKKEETVRNRENAKNVTDLLVRSIYMGRLGREQSENDLVNASAIVTGEFFKEQMSTISRILYLNIGNFLQERGNSSCFKTIQNDKAYFAGFMRYFVQWFFEKMEEEEQSLNLERIVKNVSEMLDEKYKEGELSTRMQELHENMFVSTCIVMAYLSEMLGGDSKNVSDFNEKSERIINELIRDTWYKSLDYRPVYERAFDDIILELKIKDCRYGKAYLSARASGYEPLWVKADKDIRGISIDKNVRNKEKIWLLKLEEDYAGLLLNLRGEDILLVRQDVVCNRMRGYIKENAKEWNMRYYESCYTDKKITDALADSNRIFVHIRSDGTDRVFNYPLVQDNTDYKAENIEAVEIDFLEDIKMLKVNTVRGEKNIIDQIEDKPMEDVYRWVSVRKLISYYNDDNGLIIKINYAIEKINKFLDLK